MSHAGHKAIKCKSCDTVIAQCRCMELDKPVEWTTCSSCMAKDLNQVTETKETGPRLGSAFRSGKALEGTILFYVDSKGHMQTTRDALRFVFDTQSALLLRDWLTETFEPREEAP